MVCDIVDSQKPICYRPRHNRSSGYYPDIWKRDLLRPPHSSCHEIPLDKCILVPYGPLACGSWCRLDLVWWIWLLHGWDIPNLLLNVNTRGQVPPTDPRLQWRMCYSRNSKAVIPTAKTAWRDGGGNARTWCCLFGWYSSSTKERKKMRPTTFFKLYFRAFREDFSIQLRDFVDFRFKFKKSSFRLQFTCRKIK